MNKFLLIWNLVVTLLLAGVIITSCGPQYDYAADIRTNRELLEQVADLANENRAAVDENRQAILANKIIIETFASTTEASLKQMEAALTQYAAQYVQEYLKAHVEALH